MTLSRIKFVSRKNIWENQRTRNVATRCILGAYSAAKCDCGRGSVPDPIWGAYSSPPGSLAGFKEAASRLGGERERRGEGKG